ncbi:unnamed protein product [Didymodactylos carnosus]|uniref:C2H2-type domain-containing protein n=1 Tax=Didymodactylos carnosus TaxID=1234261 RepID=A0A8S2CZX3_9BILA|nr:unnamed protein product [Didymodactylos carnosus]CAF3562893.1 unnamed protein product [Didymodactylos carnosus]
MTLHQPASVFDSIFNELNASTSAGTTQENISSTIVSVQAPLTPLVKPLKQSSPVYDAYCSHQNQQQHDCSSTLLPMPSRMSSHQNVIAHRNEINPVHKHFVLNSPTAVTAINQSYPTKQPSPVLTRLINLKRPEPSNMSFPKTVICSCLKPNIAHDLTCPASHCPSPGEGLLSPDNRKLAPTTSVPLSLTVPQQYQSFTVKNSPPLPVTAVTPLNSNQQQQFTDFNPQIKLPRIDLQQFDNNVLTLNGIVIHTSQINQQQQGQHSPLSSASTTVINSSQQIPVVKLQDIKYIPNILPQQKKSPVMDRQKSFPVVNNRRKKRERKSASINQKGCEKVAVYENQRYSDELHTQRELEPRAQTQLSFIQNSDIIQNGCISSQMPFMSNNIVIPTSAQKNSMLQQVVVKISSPNDTTTNANMNENFLSHSNTRQIQQRPFFTNTQQQISPLQRQYSKDEIKITPSVSSATYQTLNLQPVINLQQLQINNPILVTSPIKALCSPVSSSCPPNIAIKQSAIDQTIEDVISGKVCCTSTGITSNSSKPKRAKISCQSTPTSPDKPKIFFTPIKGNPAVWQQQHSFDSTQQNFVNLSHQEFSHLAEQLIFQPLLENTTVCKQGNINNLSHKTINNSIKVKKQKTLTKKGKLGKIKPVVPISSFSSSLTLPQTTTTTTATVTTNLLTNVTINHSNTISQEQSQQQQTVVSPITPTLNLINVSTSEPSLSWSSTPATSNSQQSSNIKTLSSNTNINNGQTLASWPPAAKITAATIHQEEKNSDTWNFGKLFNTTFQLVGDYADIDNNHQQNNLDENSTDFLKSIHDQDESNHPYSCTPPPPALSQLLSSSSCSTSGSSLSISNNSQSKESKLNNNDDDLYEQFLNPSHSTSSPWHETLISTTATTSSETLIFANDNNHQQGLTERSMHIHPGQSHLTDDGDQQFQDLFLFETAQSPTPPVSNDHKDDDFLNEVLKNSSPISDCSDKPILSSDSDQTTSLTTHVTNDEFESLFSTSNSDITTQSSSFDSSSTSVNKTIIDCINDDLLFTNQLQKKHQSPIKSNSDVQLKQLLTQKSKTKTMLVTSSSSMVNKKKTTTTTSKILSKTALAVSSTSSSVNIFNKSLSTSLAPPLSSVPSLTNSSVQQIQTKDIIVSCPKCSSDKCVDITKYDFQNSAKKNFGVWECMRCGNEIFKSNLTAEARKRKIDKLVADMGEYECKFCHILYHSSTEYCTHLQTYHESSRPLNTTTTITATASLKNLSSSKSKI